MLVARQPYRTRHKNPAIRRWLKAIKCFLDGDRQSSSRYGSLFHMLIALPSFIKRAQIYCLWSLRVRHLSIWSALTRPLQPRGDNTPNGLSSPACECNRMFFAVSGFICAAGSRGADPKYNEGETRIPTILAVAGARCGGVARIP